MEIDQYGISTLTEDDYFYLVHYARYGDLPDEFFASQAKWINAIGPALGLLGKGFKVYNSVLKHQFEQDLINQITIKRLYHLKQWVGSGSQAVDPVLTDAIDDVEQDILQMIDDSYSALGESLVELINLEDIVDFATYLNSFGMIANGIFHFSSRYGLYSNMASHVLAPWLLSMKLAIHLGEDLDYIRSTALAATLYKEFQTEYGKKKQEILNGSNSIQTIQELNMFHNYGYYLAFYFHYYYLEVVNIGGFWGYINPLNWPQVIGQGLSDLFGNGNEIVDYFENRLNLVFEKIGLLCFAAIFCNSI